jgi:hypothetical protein
MRVLPKESENTRKELRSRIDRLAGIRKEVKMH